MFGRVYCKNQIENYLNNNLEGDAVEDQVDFVRRNEVEQVLNENWKSPYVSLNLIAASGVIGIQVIV